MSDKSIIYWDSCLFFEVLCDEQVAPEARAAIDDLLSANKEEKNVLVTSVITHIECVPQKLEAKKPGALATYEAMFDGVHLIDQQISANVLRLAREIKDFYCKPPDLARNFYGKMMDTGDAIHLATAIIFQADEFQTRDDNKKGSKVPLVSLYSYSGHDKVCGKYPLKIVSPTNDQGEFGI